MAIEIIPVRGIGEIGPGEDLGALVAKALRAQGIALVDGDVVVVTQKVVSKAEGRIVPELPVGKDGWVARETRRIVAKRGDLVIAETRHGFVCANAGVDASNVADGHLTLLPEDPDRSADEIRKTLSSESDAEVAVVITDTFGRSWRQGLVNVAIGCSGLPALIDLRGTKDAVGRLLEATVVALADEVAAASGLAMGKADGVPAAVVRGLHPEGLPLPAAVLVRPREEDLFRESPFQMLLSRTDVTAFDEREVPQDLVREALLAAGSALHPDQGQPWLLMEVPRGKSRAIAAAGADPAVNALLVDAPVVVLGFAGPALTGPGTSERTGAVERDRAVALLSTGAAMQNVALAFNALGLASCWIPPARMDGDQLRRALDVANRRVLAGALAAGWPVPPSP